MNDLTDRESSGSQLPSRWYAHPAFHLVLLAAQTACYLAISWRKWPDPVVDFGRELYIPWRLSEGAVLYRDVEDFYGPLSQYLNAALFRVFGPGMMVLVWANLAVFAGIVVTTYLLVRRAWGAGAAVASSGVFIAVFGFARYLYVGSFNYATPYAHEATHGVLVLVLLATVLVAWLRRSTLLLNAAGGLLFGLTLVLKAEIALAAGAIISAAVALRWLRGSSWPLRECSVAAGMAVFPTLLFAVHFHRYFDLRAAWGAACRGWLNVVMTTRYVGDPAQFKYSGLDEPWRNLGDHLMTTAGVVLVLALLAFATRLFERRLPWAGARPVSIVFMVLLGLAACAWPDNRWIQAGQCLLGLSLLYLGFQITQIIRARRCGDVPNPATDIRVLLVVLGAALMARMILAGRIYQFGFCQSALAAVVVVAIAIGELPAVLAVTAGGRRFAVAGMLAILIPGGLLLSAKSAINYLQIRLPMGSGRDQFYAFPASLSVANIAGLLEKVPPGRTLLVLPEGLMLNYLARMPSPLPHFFYYSAVTENGEEARLVTKLSANPPDFVVTLPRVLQEYGVEKYGVRSGAGGDLLAWMKSRYELQAWVRGDYKGPDPAPGEVNYSDRYVQVFGRKAPVPTAAGR